MATLQVLEVLNRLDDDSDWNEPDERDSGSEDDYDEHGYEMDYLAPVLYHSFLILIRALRCFLKYYSLSFAEDAFSKRVTFTTAHACLRVLSVNDSVR